MSSEQFLESLEARIAPAVFKPTSYSDTSVFTDVTNSTDPGIQALFAGATAGQYYYATLKSGDDLQAFNETSGFESLVKVSGGELVVFFHDQGGLGVFEANEISGVSLGAKSKVTISDSVGGDIVANYNATTHSIDATSLISDQQTITGVYVAGSVDGRIIAGGSISNVTVVGNVERVATGTAAVADSANPASFYEYSFSGVVGVGEATLTAFTLAAKKAGASITGINVGTLDDAAAASGYGSIIASDGGAGGAGGSVSKAVVVADTNGFNVLAGNGGNGTGSTGGGAGGKITDVRVLGLVDTSPNDLITIQGGNGGTGTTKGGIGGAVSTVYVGYDLPNGKTATRSANFLQDDVFIAAGSGGTGKSGGAGGSAQNVFVSVSTPDAAGDEITVLGGNGGSDGGAAAGKGGVGGSLTNLELRNYNDTPAAFGSTTLVAAGDGGLSNLASGGGTGGIGGSVKEVDILGFAYAIEAGIGADGFVKGGNGGVVQNVFVETLGNIITQQGSVIAGSGGASGKGLGGAGGGISNIQMPTSDIGSGNLFIAAGSGGDSASSTGGKGGVVQTVNVVDDFGDTTLAGDSVVLAGSGGDGGKKGGIGGDLISVTVSGYGFNSTMTAGAGGSATGSVGSGGSGGNIKTSGSSVLNFDPLTGNFANVTAGAGGDAAGKGKAGKGGSILSSNVRADGSVALVAGTGGAGDAGTSGAGGIITKVGAASSESSVSAIAGDAGDSTGSAKGALGGTLSYVSLSAFTSITILAGDGTGGGAGGNLQNIAFTGADISGPLHGNIVIQAGNGSTSTNGSVAGKGGYIKTLSGYANAYLDGGTELTAFIKAGDGASGSKKGADGGSITDLSIYGGQFDPIDVDTYGLMTIWAGEGGSSSSNGVGGKGGSITNVAIAQGVDESTGDEVNITVANVLAGDGGNSNSGKGGVGGSVTNFYSLGDIGIRSGNPYGFDANDLYGRMGGIFAGVGGTGSGGSQALAGNVISVTASAISSIVAGKNLASPDFVTKVDAIFLNGDGDNAPQTNPSGGYTNWADAVFVGGIGGNPADPGSNVFKTAGGVPWMSGDTWTPGVTQPLDGLIAALTLTTKRNFSPMAFLTLDDSGTAQFAGVRVP